MATDDGDADDDDGDEDMLVSLFTARPCATCSADLGKLLCPGTLADAIMESLNPIIDYH